MQLGFDVEFSSGLSLGRPSLRPELQAIEAGGVGGVGVLEEQRRGGWVDGSTRREGQAFFWFATLRLSFFFGARLFAASFRRPLCSSS